MCYTALPVDLYIYPTVQCYNCCRYGHVKNQCRSTPKCYKCSKGHSGDRCDVAEEDYYCCLCKGNHQATSKKCLEFGRQKAIKETMSKCCMSYMEAVKMHPPITRKSFADALLTSAPTVNQLYSTNTPTKRNYSIPNYIQSNFKNDLPRSYKKTVSLKTRTTSNNVPKGYDRVAHNEITRNPLLPKIKSVFENNNSSNNSESNRNETNATIITALIQILSQTGSLISPSNAALLIDKLYNSNNINGSRIPGHPMELPESE